MTDISDQTRPKTVLEYEAERLTFSDCQCRQCVADRAKLIANQAAMIAQSDDRLEAILDWADLACANPKEFNRHGVKNLQGPVFDAARQYFATRGVSQ